MEIFESNNMDDVHLRDMLDLGRFILDWQNQPYGKLIDEGDDHGTR